MKVAVLGAAGAIARAIVRDLGESPEVGELLLLDRDGPGAEKVAVEHGQGKARAVQLDVRDGVAEAIAGAAVLVNAAGRRLNLDAMAAALAAGCHYVDLGGLYWMTASQLELDEQFVAAGLLAVLGMGASPGTTNVMALRAVHELGGAAIEEIRVSAAGWDPGPGLGYPCALRTLIDELTMAPVVLEGGVPRALAPLAPGGVVEFPEPIGRASTIHTLHSEVASFGHSFHVQKASFRLSLPDELIARLEDLREAGADELAAAAAAVAPPSDQAIPAHIVEAYSATHFARVSALTRPMEAWGLGGGIVSTAAPAAAVVRLIAQGKLETFGALPPEACVDPDDLLPELERRGGAFSVELLERSVA